MTEADRQVASVRRAAREIIAPLRRQLERTERMIRSLTEKLEASERAILELKRENGRLHNEIMEKTDG